MYGAKIPASSRQNTFNIKKYNLPVKSYKVLLNSTKTTKYHADYIYLYLYIFIDIYRVYLYRDYFKLWFSQLESTKTETEPQH